MTREATPAQKATRTLLNVEIPRDELAFRLMQAAVGLAPPAGMTAREAMRDAETALPEMAASFYRQADAAVLYFHERINAAIQPN